MAKNDEKTIKTTVDAIKKTLELIKENPDGIVLTMKSLAETINTYDYHARNTLNIIRSFPDILYVYDEANKSRFKPKKFRKGTPAEKLEILNSKKTRQFDMTPEQESYMIGRLDRLNNQQGLKDIYTMGAIVEKLALKGLTAEWNQIDEKEFCNFFCLDAVDIYNYINELVAVGLLLQNPQNKYYKVALSAESFDKINAEIEEIYANGLVEEVKGDKKASSDLDEICQNYEKLRDKMNQMHSLIMGQNDILEKLKKREAVLAGQIEKAEDLKQLNARLKKENESLAAERDELKKFKELDEQLQKEYKIYVNDKLNALYSELSIIIDEHRDDMVHATSKAQITKIANRLKVEMSNKLLSEDLIFSILNYGKKA